MIIWVSNEHCCDHLDDHIGQDYNMGHQNDHLGEHRNDHICDQIFQDYSRDHLSDHRLIVSIALH